MQKHWFLKRWFIQGLVISLPIIITAVIFFYCISYTDKLLWLIAGLLPTSIPKPVFPGMGLVLIVTLLILMGALTENFIIHKVLNLFNFIMSKVPFIRNVYPTALKIVQGLLGSPDKFSKVLLIEYPRDGIYTLVFKTNNAPSCLNALTGKKMISVFLPTAPFLTNGLYLIIPEDRTIETIFKPEEAFKLIVSAGMVNEDKGGVL